MPITNVTFNLIAVMVVLGIGHSLGEYYKLNSIYTVFSSLIGFLIVTPVESFTGGSGYALSNFGINVNIYRNYTCDYMHRSI